MLFGELVVIDAVDDGEVGAVGGRGDDDALGARGQQRRRLVARGEDAGAFERDVDAEILVGQFGRALDRRDLDLAAADADRIAVDGDFVRKASVHAVEAQQMRVGLDGPEVVDRHHLDVRAARFDDGAQDVAPDAPEPVDRYPHRHVELSSKGPALGPVAMDAGLAASFLVDPQPCAMTLVNWNRRRRHIQYFCQAWACRFDLQGILGGGVALTRLLPPR